METIQSQQRDPVEGVQLSSLESGTIFGTNLSGRTLRACDVQQAEITQTMELAGEME
jgi:hypothetical protein